MPLILKNVHPVILELYPTSTGELQARYRPPEPDEAIDVASHGDAVLARSASSLIRFELVGPSDWQLEASHENEEGSSVSWSSSSGGLAHEQPSATTDPLEVTATATNAAGEVKKKVLYLEAKPGGALPDSP